MNAALKDPNFCLRFPFMGFKERRSLVNRRYNLSGSLFYIIIFLFFVFVLLLLFVCLFF